MSSHSRKELLLYKQYPHNKKYEQIVKASPGFSYKVCSWVNIITAYLLFYCLFTLNFHVTVSPLISHNINFVQHGFTKHTAIVW